MKDNASVFKTIGASNHTDTDREPNDYYATEPIAMDLLLAEENFHHKVWECACGEGHLSRRLKAHGYEVSSTDLIDRGYGRVLDFFRVTEKFDGDIITNPPYMFATEFVEHALELIGENHKVAMFLKLTFLEGKKRKIFFEKNPPKTVYVCSGRINCARNGDFEKYESSAIAYAWFVWEKVYKGSPVIKWIN